MTIEFVSIGTGKPRVKRGAKSTVADKPAAAGKSLACGFTAFAGTSLSRVLMHKIKCHRVLPFYMMRKSRLLFR